MSAAALLARLAELNVRLWTDGDRLRFDAPRDVVTPDLLDQLRANKADLLRLLGGRARPRSYPCASCGKFFFPEPAVLCFWCRRPPQSERDRGFDREPDADARAGAGGDGGRCASCGGGLGREDSDGGPCWSCRRLAGATS